MDDAIGYYYGRVDRFRFSCTRPTFGTCMYDDICVVYDVRGRQSLKAENGPNCKFGQEVASKCDEERLRFWSETVGYYYGRNEWIVSDFPALVRHLNWKNMLYCMYDDVYDIGRLVPVE